jgi:hypothetical protein
MSRTVSVPGDNAGRPAGASGDQPAVTAPTPGRLRPWRYPSNEHQARDAGLERASLMIATSRATYCRLCWAAAELVLTCMASRAPQDRNVSQVFTFGCELAVRGVIGVLSTG